MLCKQCGAEIEDTAIFCENCGARQKSVEYNDDKTFWIFDEPSPQNETFMAENPSGRSQSVNQAQAQQQAYGNYSHAQASGQNYANDSQPQASGQSYANNSQPQAPKQSYANSPRPQAAQQGYANSPQPQAAQYSSAPANIKVSCGTAISLYFENYFNFSGRASKLEYCWIWMLTQAISVLEYILSIILQTNFGSTEAAWTILIVNSIIAAVTTIPSLSLTIRRLHDIGKPWTWCFIILIPIAGLFIFLYYMMIKNSDGDNRWGPAPGNGVSRFVQAPTHTGAPVNTDRAYQKAISDNDIYVIAQQYAPFDLNAPGAKAQMDSALGRLIPTFTGIENLSGVIMICDQKILSNNIALTDTDTLFVAFKALCYYMGQGCDANTLGAVRQEIVSVLKSRV